MVFHPSTELVSTPRAKKLTYQDVILDSSNDSKIHGWWLPHASATHTLLFFHGNAGNISHRMETLAIFHQLGLNVLIIDYQGYGQSGGTPTEQNTYDDAQVAWQHLTGDLNIAPNRIIIAGRSLGGAVAAWLAAQLSLSEHDARKSDGYAKNLPAALVLESTFASIAAVGKDHYPYLPVRLLSRIHYDSASLMASIRCPVLIIHSREDELIDFSHGQRLFKLVQADRQFLEIRGAHNGGFLEDIDNYFKGWRQFLTVLNSATS